MGLPSPRECFCSLLTIFAILELSAATDYTTLVYKGCAKQYLTDPSGVYSQGLSSLFGTLISQSSKAKFFKTTAGTGQTTITGLFQCRGDISNVDCYNCVSKLPILIDKLCGKTIAARIQLLGCYMLYEVSGFPQISGMELLYKICSGKNVGGAEFEERRDTALSTLENGMSSSNSNGFYTTSYQSVYAVAQCESDIGGSDCVECVKTSVQRAQVECGSSVSAQVYLHKCFISYSYYPNGAPDTSSSSSSSSANSYSSPSFSSGIIITAILSSFCFCIDEHGTGSGSGSGSGFGSGGSTGRTVAIILGGAAGVGFVVICLLFARGLMKQKDGK